MSTSSKAAAALGLGRLLAGRRSEQRALHYLLRRGAQLLARNYRCRQGEIDLIVQDGDATVFVEVRYRNSRRFGGPKASITHAKRQRIIKAAKHYLAANPAAADGACRFDVVSMEQGAHGNTCIEWLQDAFRAEQPI